MSFAEDMQRGRYAIRGALSVQNGTSLLNLHAATAIDALPAEQDMDLLVRPVLLAGINNPSVGFYNQLGITAAQTTGGPVGLLVIKNNQAAASYTYPAPTTATVAAVSGEAVPLNTARKGLILCNISANWISLAVNAAAVLYSGITLPPQGGTWEMDEYTFTTGQIRSISSAAGSVLAIQELT